MSMMGNNDIGRIIDIAHYVTDNEICKVYKDKVIMHVRDTVLTTKAEYGSVIVVAKRKHNISASEQTIQICNIFGIDYDDGLNADFIDAGNLLYTSFYYR